MLNSVLNILNHRLVEVSHTNIGAWEVFYFSFNALEAVCWGVFALLVLLRWKKHRHSRLELFYALLFLLFGISDVIEIFVYPIWLLLAKGLVLFGLWWCRKTLIARFYSGSWF